MKKLFAISLALVLMISLAACGGSGGSASNPPTNGSSATPNTDNDTSTATPAPAGGADAADEDLTTIEGWLATFGLTESDLMCAHYNRLDINSYVTSTGVITEVGVMISEALTDEEARAWVEQIIAKLNSLSDSGQIDNLLVDGEDLTADYIMEQTMYMGSGYYNYNGRTVVAMIVVMPGYLDDEDPDVAMAACSLGLEWK